ncbi:MAG: glycosyltransferase family 4 protein [Proteobacteria bacterium]|nr:glycosyltransferase family 4 protein [Pseudomonadota bacterium]MBU1593905.1 glycosyltransferase family 4 protein [Pseudomonadota bacterium]
MNIALLTTTLEGGGAARVLAHMANFWAAAGGKVTLLSFEDGSRPSFYPLDERVRVRYLALNRYSPHIFASLANNWRRFASIRRAVRAARPEAVISFIDTANVRTLIALLGTGIPVLVSERVHPRFEDIGWLWALLRRLTYPLASRLVVQTAEIAAHCKAWSLGRVAVIPNPVLPMPVRGGAPLLPRPCLLAVGRLYPQKDYGLLLRAFAATAGQHPGWSLCIAGEGPLRPQLEAAAAGPGLAGRVRLLGQVADMGGLLDQADAYALTSTYEGFPNALCEAMAAGLPCVSTDCPGGPSEIVRHNENGLLVPAGDAEALAGALSRVMGDAALRERLGARAAEVCQRFSLGRIMAQWEDVVAQCAGKRTGGHR